MKYRRIAILCLSSLLVLGVSACSGDDSDDGNGSGLIDAGPTDTMQPDTEPDPDTEQDPDMGTDTGSDTAQDTEQDMGMRGCDLLTSNGCGDMQNCYPANQGDNVCRDYVAGQNKGSTCTSLGACGEDLFCDTSQQVCATRCNPNGTPDCDSGESCIPLQGTTDFGICRANCELYPNDNCEGDQKCYPFSNGNQCIPTNDQKSVGDSCDPNTDPCAANQICIPQTQGGDLTCRPFCDTTMTDSCPEGQSCGSISGATGACFPSGN